MQIINYIEQVICIWRRDVKIRLRKLISRKFHPRKDLLYLERQMNSTTAIQQMKTNKQKKKTTELHFISKEMTQPRQLSHSVSCIVLEFVSGDSFQKIFLTTPPYSSPGSAILNSISLVFHLLSFSIDSRAVFHPSWISSRKLELLCPYWKD